MARPSAPSMPTPLQIETVHKAVCSLYPNARIKSVGPEGVIFDYPEISAPDAKYRGIPFSAEAL